MRGPTRRVCPSTYPRGRDAESLPESIKDEIRRQLKGQS